MIKYVIIYIVSAVPMLHIFFSFSNYEMFSYIFIFIWIYLSFNLFFQYISIRLCVAKRLQVIYFSFVRNNCIASCIWSKTVMQVLKMNIVIYVPKQYICTYYVMKMQERIENKSVVKFKNSILINRNCTEFKYTLFT